MCAAYKTMQIGTLFHRLRGLRSQEKNVRPIKTWMVDDYSLIVSQNVTIL